MRLSPASDGYNGRQVERKSEAFANRDPAAMTDRR